MGTNSSGFLRSTVAWAAIVLISLIGEPSVSGQQGRFGDVTEVVVVEVPVQVIKDGEPVRGLTADDFQLSVGRKKQKITGFDVVDLTLTDPAGDSADVTRSTARRHFLFFFDLSFSDPGSLVKARQAATELVDKGLHPSDLAAVGSYSRSTGTRMVLGFTPDRDQLKAAIATLGLPQLVEARRDPLGLVFTDLRQASSIVAQPGGPGAPAFDAEAEVLEALTRMEGDTRRVTDTNEILALTSSLTGMAAMLNGVAGRKHVVYLSEGFDSSLLLGTQGVSAAEQQQIAQTNEAAMEGRVWDVQSNERFGDTNMQSQLTDMLEEFVRSDCTIQAVDIGGLRSASDVQTTRANTEDSLFIMANGTGGEFYYNYNNLYDAMGKMLQRTSVTYVLAFQPADVKLDGKYHRLKVELKGGSRGARLVHRPGYYAPRPYGSLNKIEQQLTSASAIIGAPGGDVGTSVLAAPFPSGADADTAYVPVLIEVDGASLMSGTAAGVLPTEIYAYAITNAGNVQDYFVQILGLDLGQVGPALQQSGFKYFGHLDLPPGRYNIRVLVRNGETGASGVDVFPMVVPDLAQRQALVLPPLFPEPAGKWLMGREDAAQQGNYAYPFMSQETPYIPAARPAVRAGEQAKISLVTYNLGSGDPEVAAAIYGPEGDKLADVEIVLDLEEPGQDPSMSRFAATCEIPDLELGNYKLEVTVESPAGGDAQSSAIEIQIVG